MWKWRRHGCFSAKADVGFGCTLSDRKVLCRPANLSPETAAIKFARGDSRAKKEVLARIGSNLALKDKKLIIKASGPFAFIRDFNSDAITENEWIEPENTLVASGQIEPSDSQNVSLLRDLDSNQDERFQRPLSYH